jgi:hypothetical protein
MYSLVSDLHEDGLQGPQHIQAASQNNKYLLLFVQLVQLNTVYLMYTFL